MKGLAATHRFDAGRVFAAFRRARLSQDRHDVILSTPGTVGTVGGPLHTLWPALRRRRLRGGGQRPLVW